MLHDIEQFAQNGFASLSAEDLARLRWVGLFARDTTPGCFMLHSPTVRRANNPSMDDFGSTGRAVWTIGYGYHEASRRAITLDSN
ncbi:MAG: hypothetical protein OWR52_03620 [Acidibacillus sp.]|nr:hypothetical protein [Acidibacillus sp.]